MTTAKKKASPKAKTATPKVVVAPKDPIKQLDDEYKQKRRALMRDIRKQQRETAQSDLKIAKKQIGILISSLTEPHSLLPTLHYSSATPDSRWLTSTVLQLC